MLIPIGKFTPTPGTPVRLTSTQANPAEKFACHGVMVQALKANAGRCYVGTSVLDKTNSTGVYAVLAIPTNNTIPSFTAALTLSPNAINLSDMYVDVDQAGDGVIVSVLIA